MLAGQLDEGGPSAATPQPGATQQQQHPNTGKAPRKPYRLTKPRTSWLPHEHEKFLTAVSLYGRNWKKIEEYVGTKSSVQIRSHAQKHFAKVERGDAGTESIAIPPPRYKRKSTKPKVEQRLQFEHHQQLETQQELEHQQQCQQAQHQQQQSGGGATARAEFDSKHSSNASAFQVIQSDAASPSPTNAATIASASTEVHAQLKALIASHNAQLLQQQSSQASLQSIISNSFTWQSGNFDLHQSLSKQAAPGIPTFSNGFWAMQQAPSAPLGVLQPVILQPPPPLLNTAASAPPLGPSPPLAQAASATPRGMSQPLACTPSLPTGIVPAASIASLVAGADPSDDNAAPVAATMPCGGAGSGSMDCVGAGEGLAGMERSNAGAASVATMPSAADTKPELRGASATAWSSMETKGSRCTNKAVSPVEGSGGTGVSGTQMHGSWSAAAPDSWGSNEESGGGSAMGSVGEAGARLGSSTSCLTAGGSSQGSGVLRPQARHYHAPHAPGQLAHWAEEQGRERAVGTMLAATTAPSSAAGAAAAAAAAAAAVANGVQPAAAAAMEVRRVKRASSDMGGVCRVPSRTPPQVEEPLGLSVVGVSPLGTEEEGCKATGASSGFEPAGSAIAQAQQQEFFTGKTAAAGGPNSPHLPHNQGRDGAAQWVVGPAELQDPHVPVVTGSEILDKAAKIPDPSAAADAGASHGCGSNAPFSNKGIPDASQSECLPPLAKGTGGRSAAGRSAGRSTDSGGGAGSSGSDSGSRGGHPHRSKLQRRQPHASNSRNGSLDMLRALSSAHSLQRNRASSAHPSAVIGSSGSYSMRAPAISSSPPPPGIAHAVANAASRHGQSGSRTTDALLAAAAAAAAAASAAEPPQGHSPGMSLSLASGPVAAAANPAPVAASAAGQTATAAPQQPEVLPVPHSSGAHTEWQGSNAWALRSGCGSDSKSGGSAGGVSGGNCILEAAQVNHRGGGSMSWGVSREGSREGDGLGSMGEGEGSGNSSRNGAGCGSVEDGKAGSNAGGSREGGSGSGGGASCDGGVLSRDERPGAVQAGGDGGCFSLCVALDRQGRPSANEVRMERERQQKEQQEAEEGFEPPCGVAAGSALAEPPSAFAPYHASMHNTPAATPHAAAPPEVVPEDGSCLLPAMEPAAQQQVDARNDSGSSDDMAEERGQGAASDGMAEDQLPPGTAPEGNMTEQGHTCAVEEGGIVLEQPRGLMPVGNIGTAGAGALPVWAQTTTAAAAAAGMAASAMNEAAAVAVADVQASMIATSRGGATAAAAANAAGQPTPMQG